MSDNQSDGIDLDAAGDALDPESAGWGVLIDGPGGIGKTALAIRAGHLTPDKHYSDKIFLSAKARALTPRGEQKTDSGCRQRTLKRTVRFRPLVCFRVR